MRFLWPNTQEVDPVAIEFEARLAAAKERDERADAQFVRQTALSYALKLVDTIAKATPNIEVDIGELVMTVATKFENYILGVEPKKERKRK
jgi:hypothetical protein